MKLIHCQTRVSRVLHPTSARYAASRPGSRVSAPGFSLVEIMVAVGLLSVILIGLLAMFYQTQRAFRLGVGQVDVMEAGRLAMEGIGPELQETVASGQEFIVNLRIQENENFGPSVQSLPASTPEFRTNSLLDVYFLRRRGDDWVGTAYRVSSWPAGSLYKLEVPMRKDQLSQLDALFKSKLSDDVGVALADDPPFHRLIDGGVHFALIPYDQDGIPIWNGSTNIVSTNVVAALPDRQIYDFRQDALPASVEIQLGILEGPAYETYLARPDPTLAANYLQQQAGKVHIFRKRIPIRAGQ